MDLLGHVKQKLRTSERLPDPGQVECEEGAGNSICEDSRAGQSEQTRLYQSIKREKAKQQAKKKKETKDAKTYHKQ